MSKTINNIRVQHKRDTSTNWAKAVNFVPLAGEIIVYSDLNKIKIGDGVTNVNELEFTDEDKVDKVQTIAGIDLQDNITKSEMLTALNIEDGAEVNNIFVAQYEVTTFVEIQNAVNAGKSVVCKESNGQISLLQMIDNGGAYFIRPQNNPPCLILTTKLSSGQWIQAAKFLELTSNKTIAIDVESTDIQYPSAKAVFDAIPLKDGMSNGSSNNSQSTAGAKGWKWSSAQLIESDTLLKIYPIGEFFDKIKVNDRVSVKAGYSWNFFGSVDSVDSESISVIRDSTYPIPENFTPANYSDSDSGYFWLPDKPNAGVFVIGEGSMAIGIGNKANEQGAIVGGKNNLADGRYSAVFGTDNEGGYAALVQGHSNNVTGLMGTALGYGNNVQGDRSLAVGESNTAKGINSFALGHTNLAQGDSSFAVGSGVIVKSFAGYGEGHLTEVEGEAGHAEGRQTKAKGDYSHAEGVGTQAEGIYSHAENAFTLASSKCQHVQGKYNVEDKEGKYVDIVGWGTSQQRKNISALKTDGTLVLKGGLTLGANDNSTGGVTITAAQLQALLALIPSQE